MDPSFPGGANGRRPCRTGEIAETVQAAVSRGHHIRIADLRLVAAGTIPRTTSGRLARRACRAEYIAGRFNR